MKRLVAGALVAGLAACSGSGSEERNLPDIPPVAEVTTVNAGEPHRLFHYVDALKIDGIHTTYESIQEGLSPIMNGSLQIEFPQLRDWYDNLPKDLDCLQTYSAVEIADQAGIEIAIGKQGTDAIQLTASNNSGEVSEFQVAPSGTVTVRPDNKYEQALFFEAADAIPFGSAARVPSFDAYTGDGRFYQQLSFVAINDLVENENGEVYNLRAFTDIYTSRGTAGSMLVAAETTYCPISVNT